MPRQPFEDIPKSISTTPKASEKGTAAVSSPPQKMMNSSMPTRSSSSRRTTQQQKQQQQQQVALPKQLEHARPRPISTGRLQSNASNSSSTKAVMPPTEKAPPVGPSKSRDADESPRMYRSRSRGNAIQQQQQPQPQPQPQQQQYMRRSMSERRPGRQPPASSQSMSQHSPHRSNRDSSPMARDPSPMARVRQQQQQQQHRSSPSNGNYAGQQQQQQQQQMTNRQNSNASMSSNYQQQRQQQIRRSGSGGNLLNASGGGNSTGRTATGAPPSPSRQSQTGNSNGRSSNGRSGSITSRRSMSNASLRSMALSPKNSVRYGPPMSSSSPSSNGGNNNNNSSSKSNSNGHDPSSVTQAILDLREKREQAQARRLRRESSRQQRGLAQITPGATTATTGGSQPKPQQQQMMLSPTKSNGSAATGATTSKSRVIETSLSTSNRSENTNGSQQHRQLYRNNSGVSHGSHQSQKSHKSSNSGRPKMDPPVPLSTTANVGTPSTRTKQQPPQQHNISSTTANVGLQSSVMRAPSTMNGGGGAADPPTSSNGRSTSTPRHRMGTNDRNTIPRSMSTPRAATAAPSPAGSAANGMPPPSPGKRYQFYVPETDMVTELRTPLHGGGTAVASTPDKSQPQHHPNNQNLPQSPEEIEASERLQHAESKISNLMAELDELRFFNEIENSPANGGGIAPTTPGGNHEPSRFDQIQATEQLHKSPHQLLQENRAKFQHQKSSSYAHITPRVVSGMDRTELELQVQTLIREYQVLDAERSSLQATVEMCEMADVSHQEDASRIRTLEDTLRKVQVELAKSMEGVHKGRAQMTQQFERVLGDKMEDIERLRETTQLLEQELETKNHEIMEVHEEYRQIQQDNLGKYREESQKMQRQKEEYDSLVTELSTQVEVKDAQLKERDDLINDMRVELETAEQEHFSQKDLTTKEHSVKVTTLEAELELVRDELSQTRKDKFKFEEEMTSKLQKFEQSDVENENLVAVLQEELTEAKSQYDAQLKETIKTQEEKEGRRLDELVNTQQQQVEDYKVRLQNLQEQLTLSRDRHQNDIAQKEQEVEEKIKEATTEVENRLKTKYDHKLSAAETALTIANAQLESTKEESVRTLMETETKGRDTVREYERLNQLRQLELDRTNERLDRFSKEFGEKEVKVKDLQERLAEAEKRNQRSLDELESNHAEELTARDELLSSQRQRWNATESKLRTEISRKESELVVMQELADDGTSQLKDELSQVRKELDASAKIESELEEQTKKVHELQEMLEQKETQIASETARQEDVKAELKIEIAKLGGKLAAADSNLKEKRGIIEELEHQLSHRAEVSTNSDVKLKSEITSVKQQMDNLRATLDKANDELEEKNKKIAGLESVLESDKKELSQMASLQDSVASMLTTLGATKAEKTAQTEKLSKLQEEHDETLEKLRSIESKQEEQQQLSSSASKDFEAKERQLHDKVDEQTSTISSLEKKLEARTEAASALQEQIDTLKTELDNAIDQSMSRQKDVETARELENKLHKSERSKFEMYDKMDKIQKEKNEMDDAVEQLITEMQHRDHELDALTEILEKRDKELEHAKLIATKAIASAQEIKAYYKERGGAGSVSSASTSDKSAAKLKAETKQFKTQLDDLNRAVQALSEENDQLADDNAKLETSLLDKNKEVARLIMKMQDLEEKKEDDVSARMGRGLSSRGGSADETNSFEQIFDSSGFISIGASTEQDDGFRHYPIGNGSAEGNNHHDEDPDDHPDDESAHSSHSAAMAGEATKWFQDFDETSMNSTKGGLESVADESAAPPHQPDLPKQASQPSETSAAAGSTSADQNKPPPANPANGRSLSARRSRRSIEREALRKYVKKRYQKRYSNSPSGGEKASPEKSAI